MIITEIETLQLPEHPRFLWVLIHTDEGITGIGESTDKAELTKAAVHGMCADILLGQEPTRIEYLWDLMYDAANYHGFAGAEMRAMSAVDIALWDILGQVAGLPVYKLLGGAVRDSVKLYNTCISYRHIRDRERFMTDAGALASELLAEGITGMKIWPADGYSERYSGQYISYCDLQKAIEPVRKIRQAVGDRMEIAFEAHSRWNMPMAIRLARELERYHVAWLEDPLRVDNAGNYEALRSKVNIPILASERLFSRFQYRAFLEKNAMDLVMVDIGWTGGFTECKKIASMADAYRIPVTTHNCGGPVMTMASAHLCVSTPNACGTESVRAFYRTFYKELVEEEPDIRDGHIFLPDRPGLGIKLRPGLLERQDVLRVKSDSFKKLNFASRGDPWSQSPGDERIRAGE